MGMLDKARDGAQSLRNKWTYRDTGSTVGTPAGKSGGRSWVPNIESVWLRRIAIALALLLIFYYPIGAWITHTVDDNLEYEIQTEVLPGQSRAVAITADLIDREVNQNNWVANNPFFLPAAILDNMPNFQKGVIAALARFSFELTDQLGRTRGSSEADPDLQSAAGLLQYPGDVWVWDPTTSLAPTATSEAQYRRAMRALRDYNSRLAAGDATFQRRADNLLATLDRIALDIGSTSAVIDRHVLERSGLPLDTQADDVFYSTKGQVYGYYMILRELRKDFDALIVERELTDAWDELMLSMKQTVDLNPWVIIDGAPDAQFIPSHLSAQGFYLLRARTQLREITNILLK